MRKFSHRGGVVGRRQRALERLETVKEPNARQKKEIEILTERLETVKEPNARQKKEIEILTERLKRV